MRIKKSHLLHTIRENLKRIMAEGRGVSGDTIIFTYRNLEVGPVMVHASVSPPVPSTRWQPAEGGEVEILGLELNGVPVTLGDLTSQENEALAQIGEPPMSEEDLIRRFEEAAAEVGPDVQDDF